MTAEQLNKAGFRSPTSRATRFARPLVAQLICRLGLAAPRVSHGILGRSEWWLRALAEKLNVGASRVRGWMFKGYVHWRKLPGGKYVVWADREELARLKKLRDWSLRDGAYPEQLTLPKARSNETTTGKHKPKAGGKRRDQSSR